MIMLQSDWGCQPFMNKCIGRPTERTKPTLAAWTANTARSTNQWPLCSRVLFLWMTTCGTDRQTDSCFTLTAMDATNVTSDIVLMKAKRFPLPTATLVIHLLSSSRLGAYTYECLFTFSSDSCSVSWFLKYRRRIELFANVLATSGARPWPHSSAC